MMNSQVLGDNTSAVEVSHISSHGIWILASGKESFLPYDDFPWFREATVGQVLNVIEQSPGHYYWPDLDVDLSEKIIESPEKYPLKANIDR
jgi:hypothetical protein